MDLHVDGNTRVTLIVADPISQVQTPQALNLLALERGVNSVMVPCQVSAQDLKAVLDAVRCMQSVDGLVVTMPHKSAAALYCDDLSPNAARVGAVNAIRRTSDGELIGQNFDGTGFVEALRSKGFAPGGRSALIVGAGGVAAAIAFALADAGIGSLHIRNRSSSRSTELAERLVASFPQLRVITSEELPSDVDIAINATSLGRSADDPLPLPRHDLSPGMWAADVIISASDTAFLAFARARGCKLQHGSEMLAKQLELIADFLGVSPESSRG